VTKTGDNRPIRSAKPGRGIAFFDLDGTLVRGQTQVMLVKFMRKAGKVSVWFLLGTGTWFLGYRVGLVRLTRQVRDRGAAMLRGLTESEVEQAMARFADEELVPRLHPGVIEALERHKANGEHVVILSAALEPVVRALSRRIGVEDCVGTECEMSGGRYTGRIDGPVPHANEKTRIAASFMARLDCSAMDCWAYGDHESDLSLLRWVGHPVAVSPKPGLLAAATKAGWPIIA
jgi:HAD superfamily hydrolase (TIGR01490 family)